MKNLYSFLSISFVMMCLLLSASPPSVAQSYIFNGKNHKLGFSVGYGSQNVAMALDNINERDAQKISDFFGLSGDEGLDVDYFYEVFFFQLQYYYTIGSSRTWAFEFLAQPQYNITYFKQEDDAVEETKGYEYGVNLGFIGRKNFLRNFLSLYVGISTGPHYVSGTPSRQSSGFIFSSNFFGGMNVRLLRNLYLDIRPGFRHISNAYLHHPNNGINNLVVSGGIFLAL